MSKLLDISTLVGIFGPYLLKHSPPPTCTQTNRNIQSLVMIPEVLAHMATLANTLVHMITSLQNSVPFHDLVFMFTSQLHPS